MMLRLLLVVGAYLSTLLCLQPVAVAQNTATTREKLAHIQIQREEIARVTRQLNAQLGTLGRQMHKLDVALASAHKAYLAAKAKLAETDRKLKTLKRQQHGLQQHISALKQDIVAEAIGAWQRAGRDPGWVDVLRGVPMGEIPNRRYMMKQVITFQHADKLDLQRSEAKLASVMKDVQKERDRREASRQQKASAEETLRQQLHSKRQLISHVKMSARLQRQRNAELVRQSKQLKKLLETFGGDLLATDKVSEGPSIRAEKGHLPWPLSKARIVASYGARLPRLRNRLRGVLLAPEGQHRQVKSISSGRVRYADWFGGYGLMLIVDHGDGVMTIYAHNDVLYKHLGDWVETGDLLAEAGSTGWTDKVRLYFEVRDNGRPVNPTRWCRAERR